MADDALAPAAGRDAISRRAMLKTTAATMMGALGAPAFAGQPAAASAWTPAAALPRGETRVWLGPSLWANRLQDWRLHDGRIECLAGAAGDEVRTVALLTREIVAAPGTARLRVRLGRIDGGAGFCGFLVGAGGGALDYRAAALVQKASGEGGGLMAVCEHDGRLGFRDHTSEEWPLACAGRETLERAVAGPPLDARGAWLALTVESAAGGRARLTLSRLDDDGRAVAAAAHEVDDGMVRGGIALVSSPYRGEAGARFWFSDVGTGGDRCVVHADRAFGPVLGTLFSVAGGVLKLTAQCAPIGEEAVGRARLEYRSPGGAWRAAPAPAVSGGHSALFRVEGWDASREREYRVSLADGDPWTGRIPAEPRGRALTIGLFSCAIATARSLEGGSAEPELPQAERLGRYTPKNFYFPHAALAAHAGAHEADLLVFAGDQLYEGNPTRRDGSEDPRLDYLYKWFLWIWSFRELTRDRPAILLVDDHDVYHGNVWGNGGRAAPDGDQNRGGYRCSGEFVNVVQQTQCGHNPDPYDPTPVDRGIGVYYGAFDYGGVGFAILEDRKFKTAPLQGSDLDVHEPELLGRRQEAFLADWARPRAGVHARVCLTQTLFACVQTSPAGRPLLDFDANGYPKERRDEAVRLLARAGALVLAGDQHLATVVRHGVDTFDDGVVQFSGPAAGSSWQRWFEPSPPLPNPAGRPHTGEFVDAFGNKVRVLAVANPLVTFAEYRRHRTGRGQGLGDRRLKREGYGIVRVDAAARVFVLECWPWTVDPRAPGAAQFEGWPLRIPFPAGSAAPRA